MARDFNVELAQTEGEERDEDIASDLSAAVCKICYHTSYLDDDPGVGMGGSGAWYGWGGR